MPGTGKKLANSTSTAAEEPRRERPEWLTRLMDYPQRAKQFLHEVRVEMRQVTWPAKNEVLSTTLVVILTTAFFALFLWLVDLGSARLIGQILKTLRRYVNSELMSKQWYIVHTYSGFERKVKES